METTRSLPPMPTKGGSKGSTQAETARASGSLHAASAPREHTVRGAASVPSLAHSASVLSNSGTAGVPSAASAQPKSSAAGAPRSANSGAPTIT